jgi:hypothetical protein
MTKKKTGRGIISTIANKAIDLLPVEAHLPSYQYCGPGTHLAERVKRGDPGINGLDSACKQHDLAYAKYGDNKRRAEADRVLADRAWERVKDPNSSLGEKAAAWFVTNAMKVKSKLGGGSYKKKKHLKSKSGGRLHLKSKSGGRLYLTSKSGGKVVGRKKKS